MHACVQSFITYSYVYSRQPLPKEAFLYTQFNLPLFKYIAVVTIKSLWVLYRNPELDARTSNSVKKTTQEEQDETLSGTRLQWKYLPADGCPTKRRAICSDLQYIVSWDTGLPGETGEEPT